MNLSSTCRLLQLEGGQQGGTLERGTLEGAESDAQVYIYIYIYIYMYVYIYTYIYMYIYIYI